MKRSTSVVLFSLLSLTLAGTSFFLGQRLTTQKQLGPTNFFLKDKSLETFCAQPSCQTIVLRGTFAGYDYASKKMNFLTSKGIDNIFLKDNVVVDDSYDSKYFEDKIRKGDVIYVVYNATDSTGKNLILTDVYIYKTGILTTKKLPQ